MSPEKFFKLNRLVTVFDTDYTTWEGAKERNWSGKNEHREIFRLTALKIDLLTSKILSSFSRIVRPRKNPILSDFALQFHHAKQSEIDAGVDFSDMYKDFLVWSDTVLICSFDRNLDNNGDGTILKENLDLYKLDLPYQKTRFYNLAELFKAVGIDIMNTSDSDIFKMFQIELWGHEHDSSHDVRSLALSLIALKEQVEMTKINIPKL
jgi:inhibitor of KinA sporulation pathway (predicted exonuclease)